MIFGDLQKLSEKIAKSCKNFPSLFNFATFHLLSFKDDPIQFPFIMFAQMQPKNKGDD
jgi:hypothetical protein